MNENLLHYIWQFCHFDVTSLVTTKQQRISILKVGTHNFDAGPDFKSAQIRIADLVWNGDVEIHVNSSDWNKHRHQYDEKYNSVILHVVWKRDEEFYTSSGDEIPCLELCGIVDRYLLNRYENLMNSKSKILCEPYISEIDTFQVNQFLERLLIERLEEKTNQFINEFEIEKNNWEATFYNALFYTVGLRVNSTTMLELSKHLPLSILQKHKNSLFQIEAMLFGVAGFLVGVKDYYSTSLKKEYSFFKHKYGLKELKESDWMFMRLRPSSFPTIRIAQLAVLLHQNVHLFSKVLDAKSLGEMHKLFESSVSDYWLTHYHFKKESAKRKKSFGRELINSIIINAICPMLFAYSRRKSESTYQDMAIRLLEECKAENNSIVRQFTNIGITPNSAAQSQALLQLKRKYCESKKCLNCNIGNQLLKG